MIGNGVSRPPKPTEVQCCEHCEKEMNCFFDSSKGKWRFACNSCKNKRAYERNPNHYKELKSREKQRGYPRNRGKNNNKRRLKHNPNYYKELALKYPTRRVAIPGPRSKSKSITVKRYLEMFEAQGGVCASCGYPETEKVRGKVKTLSTDHNHTTGELRGLLCGKCNRGIGLFFDDPIRLRAAANYLERWASKE